MKTLSVSEFKTHALSVLKTVAESGEQVIVTKRGKPVARVIPYQEPGKKTEPGKLAGTITFEKDVITPLGPEIWEAAGDIDEIPA